MTYQNEKSKAISSAIEKIRARKPRSAWEKGVTAYALELLDNLNWHVQNGYTTPEQLCNASSIRGVMLNGARDWSEFSWGGSALIYDSDIARRLCSPSELKRTRNGDRRPNSREQWLDVQARSLRQAANIAARAVMDG